MSDPKETEMVANVICRMLADRAVICRMLADRARNFGATDLLAKAHKADARLYHQIMEEAELILDAVDDYRSGRPAR